MVTEVRHAVLLGYKLCIFFKEKENIQKLVGVADQTSIPFIRLKGFLQCIALLIAMSSTNYLPRLAHHGL